MNHMLKRLVPIACVAALLALLTTWGPTDARAGSDADEIKALVESCYVHGAFNELDPEAMKRGFHPDFAIFSPKGEEISKYPITEWTERMAQLKASADFDPAKNQWEHHFASVDVTGHAAAVKIELSKDGKLVFTDYLSLLKFDSGWRIVAKVYYRHEE